MSDTLSTYLTNLRSRLDESTARYWTDAELTVWINNGANDVARRAEVLMATTTLNTTANTQQYALPTNTIRVYRTEWSRDGATGTTVIPLEYRDFNSMDGVWWSRQKTSRGDPYWYTMWGFPPSINLVLYPTPDVSVTAGINVYYYRLPTVATTSTNVIEVPQGWEDLVLDFAEYNAWRKDNNPQWQESKQLYEGKLADLTEHSRRWTDQADSIQSGGGPLPRWVWDADFGF
jgi:hypothetical protein